MGQDVVYLTCYVENILTCVRIEVADIFAAESSVDHWCQRIVEFGGALEQIHIIRRDEVIVRADKSIRAIA